MDDLPTEFDAVVVGTGMIESIVAAAISRIGKSVLHLDSQDYYGDNWASFNLENIEHWMDNVEKINVKDNAINKYEINVNESLIIITRNSNVVNVKFNKFFESSNTLTSQEMKEVDKKNVEDGHLDDCLANATSFSESLQEKFKRLDKRFNLDLCPKLLFSKGLMVELLISSNVAKYAEFKSLNRVLTWRNNQLEPVPCSRADVFATKNVSVVEKRILVKILTLFSNYTENLAEFKDFENKSFKDFLLHKKLPENLIHYILYAIAMGDETTSCMAGVKACQAFLASLGRYGNTPFIFPMYGSGELPQCFCRLCAVFGGIYCLKREVDCLVALENKCTGIISNGNRLTAENYILSSSYSVPKHFSHEDCASISRGIFITDRSILKGDKDSMTLLQFPPVPQVLPKPVTVLELGPGTNTCPEDFYVVHLTCKASKEASSDLKHVIESLFESGEPEEKCGRNVEMSKPRILWSLTWNVMGVDRGEKEKKIFPLTNVKICPNVDCDIDYDYSINEAKRIFNELYPNEEFLPRAPDPDDIVLENPENESSQEDVENSSSPQQQQQPRENTSEG